MKLWKLFKNTLKKLGFVPSLTLVKSMSFRSRYIIFNKGTPWVEDLVSRVPSSRLHIEFYGPDLTKEALYREFRTFGRIVDITLQSSTSKDLPRFALVEFLRKRAATSARNCIHGETFGETKLAIGYETVRRGHQFWTWALANLRLSIPILLGVVTGFTFVVFDPLRIFSITNKITDRYSLKEYTNIAHETISWAMSIFSGLIGHKSLFVKPQISGDGWTERLETQQKLMTHVKEMPESVILLTVFDFHVGTQRIRKN